jgi:lipopolysaccharide export system permease protein
VRFREAQERFLGELLFPPRGLEPLLRHSFKIEAHQRILVPLSVFSFALIPLACLLPGDFNRRGQLRRVILAIGAAFLFQTTALGVDDLASRFAAAIPLMYVIDLLPFAIGTASLFSGQLSLGLRWSTLASVRAR